MEYTVLGRTGLRVSVVGLGAGGPSRLGQEAGKSTAESVAVVRRALELGINFFDTAEAYGTESIIGQAIKVVRREEVVLSTKKAAFREGRPIRAADFVAGVEESLKRLGTDYIDVFHLHGVKPDEYRQAMSGIVPALLKLREQGKVRFLGITEHFSGDTQHRMLQRALRDDCWDVVMVGFNMLNPSARRTVFPQTIARDVGVLIMFAVRRAFSNPARLREILDQLVQSGQLEPDAFDTSDPLGFLMHEGGAVSLTDAAYRFCRHEPGVHVVLTGTGNIAHLEENVHSLLRPPLPAADLKKLADLFGHIDSIAGN